MDGFEEETPAVISVALTNSALDVLDVANLTLAEAV